MKLPIEVQIADGSAYVRYADGAVDRTDDVTTTGSVAADVDASDRIIGIEVLDVIDDKQTAAAAAFARHRGLEFPREDLRDIGAAP